MLLNASSSLTLSLPRSSYSQDKFSRCRTDIWWRQFSPPCLRLNSPIEITLRYSYSLLFCSYNLEIYSRRSRIRTRNLLFRPRAPSIYAKMEACSRI